MTSIPFPPHDQLTPAARRRSMEFVTIAWAFGAVWVTGIAGAPFTRFASAMGATEMHFGLLAAMPFLASLLSLPASLWIDASGDRKRIFLIAMLTQRFMWVAIGLIPLWLMSAPGDRQGQQFTLLIFLGMMAITHVCQAIGGPAWVSWMADLVPQSIRGRYFARRRQLGFITAIPTALLAGLVVDRLVTDGDASSALRWCGALFVIVSVGGLIDILMFHWVPHADHKQASAGSMWLTLVRPLRDRHFIWFCLYMAALTAAVAPMGQFTTLYLVERLNVSATQVQLMLLVTPMLGQYFIVPIWGRMADRYGRKPMMAIASLGLVPVGLGWSAMNLGLIWLGYGLAIAGAMLWAAVETANFNLVIEMSGSARDPNEASGRGSGYTAVNSVILAIAGALGGLGAGWLMSSLREVRFTLGFNLAQPFGPYEILFAASALLRLLAAAIFLPKLHEPRARSTREAMEFVADNIYNNVLGVMLEPIKRFIGRGR